MVLRLLNIATIDVLSKALFEYEYRRARLDVAQIRKHQPHVVAEAPVAHGQQNIPSPNVVTTQPQYSQQMMQQSQQQQQQQQPQQQQQQMSLQPLVAIPVGTVVAAPVAMATAEPSSRPRSRDKRSHRHHHHHRDAPVTIAATKPSKRTTRPRSASITSVTSSSSSGTSSSVHVAATRSRRQRSPAGRHDHRSARRPAWQSFGRHRSLSRDPSDPREARPAVPSTFTAPPPPPPPSTTATTMAPVPSLSSEQPSLSQPLPPPSVTYPLSLPTSVGYSSSPLLPPAFPSVSAIPPLPPPPIVAAALNAPGPVGAAPLLHHRPSISEEEEEELIRRARARLGVPLPLPSVASIAPSSSLSLSSSLPYRRHANDPSMDSLPTTFDPRQYDNEHEMERVRFEVMIIYATLYPCVYVCDAPLCIWTVFESLINRLNICINNKQYQLMQVCVSLKKS
jgi:hypothetical protein